MNMVAMPSDGFYLLEVCGEEGGGVLICMLAFFRLQEWG